MRATTIRTIFFIALTAGMAIASCRSSYPTNTYTFTNGSRTPDLVHGKELLTSSCGGCHFVPGINRFIGRRIPDWPRLLGKEYSANLTASAKYSPVPHYTDDELAYLLRTGIKRNGHFVFYMLRPNITDNDLQDLIAYIRKGEGPLTATDTLVGKPHINFLGKMAIHFIAKPQPYRQRIAPPTTQLEQGRYLVDIYGCFHCHSKKLTSLNYLQPERTKGYLAGGAAFKMPTGKIYAPNITMDKETGIGNYTRNEFRVAVLHMTAPGGRKLHPPMEAFALSNEEADAIYAYLQNLPPIHHVVKGQVVAH